MAEVTLDGSRSASATPSAVTDLSLTIPTASSSCCSARPAPARRPRCAWSPGWKRRMTAGSASAAAMSRRCRRPSATSPSCSSNTRSIRTSRVFDNLAFPLRSPARRSPEAEIRHAVRRRRQAAAHRAASCRTARRSCRAARCSASPSAARWCARPSIYLMDEPLSSLDAKLRAELRLELKHIQQDLGATILYVTHDQTEAMTMAIAHRRDRSAAGWCRSARRARSTRTRRNIYVATRLGSPAINLLPRRALPDAPDAGGHHDDRRAHRASRDRQGGNGAAHGKVELDRASRRPEPPAYRSVRPAAQIVTLVDPDDRLDVGDAVDADPAPSRCSSTPDGERISGVEREWMDRVTDIADKELIEAVAATVIATPTS